jgi:hypothetical protein
MVLRKLPLAADSTGGYSHHEPSAAQAKMQQGFAASSWQCLACFGNSCSYEGHQLQHDLQALLIELGRCHVHAAAGACLNSCQLFCTLAAAAVVVPLPWACLVYACWVKCVKWTLEFKLLISRSQMQPPLGPGAWSRACTGGPCERSEPLRGWQERATTHAEHKPPPMWQRASFR